MEDEDDIEEQPVVQKARRPPGNVPRGRLQVLLMVLAAVLMMGIFFGKLLPAWRRAKGDVQYTVQPQDPGSIAQNTKNFRDVVNKAAQDAEDARRKMEATAELNKKNAQYAPQAQPYAGGYQSTTQPPVDPVEDARRKRIAEMEQRAWKARIASPSLFSLKSASPASMKENPAQPAGPEIRRTILPKDQNLSRPHHEEAAPQIDSRNTLMRSTVIQCALNNRLGGLFTGPVSCQVSSDVFSHDGSRVLIPQGSILMGTAQRVSMQHQDRLAIVFHSVHTPDIPPRIIDLGEQVGLDQLGEAGVKDKTNHHYFSTFLKTGILGVISGLAVAGTGSYYNGDGGDMVRQGVSREMAQEARRAFGEGLNRLPTITIREGTIVTIMLTRDIVFPEEKV